MGWTEIQHPHLLSNLAAYSTLGIGALLILTGLGHFIAPHKSFLLAIPLLVFFHVQCFVDATLISAENTLLFQCGLIVLSAVILWLSYRGYRSKQAAAAA